MGAALNYNESKVRAGKAVCLAAEGYLKEVHEMNFYDKLEGFRRLTVLNERAAIKTLHVSLNFDPTEKLRDDILAELASEYMQKIGFGTQPFLLYKHMDAGHPHIHIVSTTIREDGSRINTHNIGRNGSEKARKEIEQRYGLVPAERKRPKIAPEVKPVRVEGAVYGKHETRQAIAGVVAAVFSQYKFSSLPQFNAALRQFNVVADRGKEDGRIYRHKGLTYRILDKDGNKAGVPIKASALPSKPTLTALENKFRTNESGKEPSKPQLKRLVEMCLAKAGTMGELTAGLAWQNIYTALRQNETGFLYGVTFVDNGTKCVFNGSELGKDFSAAALQSRFSVEVSHQNVQQGSQEREGSSGGLNPDKSRHQQSQKTVAAPAHTNSVLDALIFVKESSENVPKSLLNKKRKKKKRKGDHL